VIDAAFIHHVDWQTAHRRNSSVNTVLAEA